MWELDYQLLDTRMFHFLHPSITLPWHLEERDDTTFGALLCLGKQTLWETRKATLAHLIHVDFSMRIPQSALFLQLIKCTPCVSVNLWRPLNAVCHVAVREHFDCFIDSIFCLLVDRVDPNTDFF